MQTPQSHKKIRRHILLAVFSVIAAFIGVQIYNYNVLYGEAWDVPSFQSNGNVDAPITLMEFTDYNCPYCRNLHPKLREVMELTDDIHYIARPFGPLGEHSTELAKLSLAAGKQGKFWEMHNAFLSRKGPIHDNFVRRIAAENGIDVRQLYEDAESEEIESYLNRNAQSASVLGIQFVPGLMINRDIYFPESADITAADLLKAIQAARR